MKQKKKKYWVIFNLIWLSGAGRFRAHAAVVSWGGWGVTSHGLPSSITMRITVATASLVMVAMPSKSPALANASATPTPPPPPTLHYHHSESQSDHKRKVAKQGP